MLRFVKTASPLIATRLFFLKFVDYFIVSYLEKIFTMHPLKKFIRSKDISVAEFIDRYRLEFSRSFIQGILDGYANLGKASAQKLSQATGIPKEVLMFPEDYPDYKV